MATTMVKWFQHPMERFMDKVAIVSVSTYRDRYLDELESKRAAGFDVKSRGSTETQ
ncbi:hypothetical protein chiPu_0022443, partial [Chiloscyllium punctatum]|nr:hypothetical protein [Chiloscyllium punctatum]